MIELIKPYGFHSFVELYENLVENGLAGEKDISLQRRPDPDVGVTIATKNPRKWEEISLNVEYIKSRAFEEIYPLLPTPEQKWYANDLERTLSSVGFSYISFFARYQSLPTRKEFKPRPADPAENDK